LYKCWLKEVDLTLGPYGLDLQWFEAFEPAGYVAGGSETLLVKYPQKEISSSSLFEVFDLTVKFNNLKLKDFLTKVPCRSGSSGLPL
jgi:hypothetical protein